MLSVATQTPLILSRAEGPSRRIKSPYRCLAAAGLLALALALVAPLAVPSLHAQALPTTGETAASSISAKAMAHIMARHGPESSAPGAGKYASGTTPDTIRTLVAEALRNAQPTQDTNFRPALLYDYRFPRVIGTTIEGTPTNRIRVVVGRSDGAVITAYPR